MVKDFTPHHGTDLCATCRYAFIREDVHGRKVVRCTAGFQDNGFVTAPTVRCNHYENKNTPNKYDMEKIAWIITPDPKGKIGFTQYKDMNNEERKKLGLNPDWSTE